jgi:hypothetical protein
MTRLLSLTLQAHTNYVDCVRWLHNDLVLTKSVTNKIALWRPHRRSGDASTEKGLIELIAVCPELICIQIKALCKHPLSSRFGPAITVDCTSVNI